MKFTEWLEENHYNIIIAMLLAVLFWGIIVSQIKIVFLSSESVPYRVCLQVYNLKPEKGALCAFKFKDRTFVKYLAGTAGDEIRHVGRVVYVGGERVGKAKEREYLNIIPEGKIPEGYVFMAGTHEDSFDSRYKEFGLVPVSDIRGKAFGIIREKGER